jgi:hypothetical protein
MAQVMAMSANLFAMAYVATAFATLKRHRALSRVRGRAGVLGDVFGNRTSHRAAICALTVRRREQRSNAFRCRPRLHKPDISALPAGQVLCGNAGLRCFCSGQQESAQVGGHDGNRLDSPPAFNIKTSEVDFLSALRAAFLCIRCCGVLRAEIRLPRCHSLYPCSPSANGVPKGKPLPRGSTVAGRHPPITVATQRGTPGGMMILYKSGTWVSLRTPNNPQEAALASNPVAVITALPVAPCRVRG